MQFANQGIIDKLYLAEYAEYAELKRTFSFK